ncbi:NlpC/P60 family protein [Virgibacillus byunsanensis]|uniref:NlpC/P60 family protein n=1 Tax=Virgibacillus byunsanensis TaxID=570945 RepID=A0ABW3LPU8_9BACI
MLNGTVEHVVKQSFLYSYMLSQPFAVYVDAYPVLQNKLLLEAEEIQYGEHGETTRVLQQKLNKLSYYDDSIDGDFGLLTEYALKKFQADHNVGVTGQADRKTLYAIIELERETYMEQLEDLSGTVYPGMHDNDVKIVQRSLQYFGYYEGEIDGIYGPLTKKALQIAEDEHDIELMEEITQESLTTMYEDENTEQQQQQTQVETKSKEEAKEKETEVVQVKTQTYDNTDIIQTAHSLIGTPYVWGGTSTSGFDCSGFLQYIFQTRNVTIPRTVSDIWNFSQHVDSPSVGDLVFYETYKPGPSHAGIYIGDGKFIHAGSSRGVEISEMSTSYWQQRYLGSKRVK